MLHAGLSAQFGPKQRITHGARCRFEEVNESRQRDLFVWIGDSPGISNVFAQQTIDRRALAAQFQNYIGQDVRADGRRTDLLSHHFFCWVPASSNESTFTV